MSPIDPFLGLLRPSFWDYPDFLDGFYTSLGDVGASCTSVGDRKRKLRILEPSRGSDTPLTMPLNNPRFLCRSRPRYPELLKAALNALVADERTVDGPEDLTQETKALAAYSYTSRSGRAGFLYQTAPLNS